MIIFWSVPFIDKKNYEDIVCTTSAGELISKRTFLRAWKHRYINTNDLSNEDELLVDIALQGQILMSDPSYLIALKDLFVDERGTATPDGSCYSVNAPDYYENASGNRISYNEYCAELFGFSDMITTHQGLHVPSNLSEEVARSQNIPELVPFRKEDFAFSEEQIQTLNQFIQNFLNLCESSLCKQNNSMTLRPKGENNFSLMKKITEEQYIASLIIFRRLYGNEPASFSKAVGILQDQRVNKHPIIQVINRARREYNCLLSKKISEIFFYGDMIKENMNGTFCPTAEQLINVFFNVNSIHQGDRSLPLKKNIETSIPSEELLQFVFWTTLIELYGKMSIVANCAINILSFLEKLTVKSIKPTISNNEHLFHIYIVNKVYELAEIIWNKMGRDTCSMMFYRDTAFARIANRFNLDKDVFKELLPNVDYNKITKIKKSI